LLQILVSILKKQTYIFISVTNFSNHLLSALISSATRANISANKKELKRALPLHLLIFRGGLMNSLFWRVHFNARKLFNMLLKKAREKKSASV